MTDPFTVIKNPGQHWSSDQAPCLTCKKLVTRTGACWSWITADSNLGPCCSAACLTQALAELPLAGAHRVRVVKRPKVAH